MEQKQPSPHRRDIWEHPDILLKITVCACCLGSFPDEEVLGRLRQVSQFWRQLICPEMVMRLRGLPEYAALTKANWFTSFELNLQLDEAGQLRPGRCTKIAPRQISLFEGFSLKNGVLELEEDVDPRATTSMLRLKPSRKAVLEAHPINLDRYCRHRFASEREFPVHNGEVIIVTNERIPILALLFEHTPTANEGAHNELQLAMTALGMALQGTTHSMPKLKRRFGRILERIRPIIGLPPTVPNSPDGA